MRFVLSRLVKGAAGARTERVLLLGGFGMAGATQESEGSSGEPGVGRALALLTEALQIVDSLGVYADVGARLQDIIEVLEEPRSQSPPVQMP